MLIIYIDIVLLVILLCLTVFTCGYCFYRVYRLQQTGQVTILLRPTKVLFSHKGDTTEALRTVVAYQNPFTGDYCVHKSRHGPKGYVNAVQNVPESPDSGLSDEYEPLNLEPAAAPQHHQPPLVNGKPAITRSLPQLPQSPMKAGPRAPAPEDNSVNKTWNWNYTEYQI